MLQHNLYGCVDLLQKFMPTKTKTREGLVKFILLLYVYVIEIIIFIHNSHDDMMTS